MIQSIVKIYTTNCTRDEAEELKQYLRDNHWRWSEEEGDDEDD